MHPTSNIKINRILEGFILGGEVKCIDKTKLWEGLYSKKLYI